MSSTTIVSQATPVGNSAIAIVRLSGPSSVSYSKKLSKNKTPFKHQKPKYLPVYIKKTKKVDSAIYMYFKSPNSYTGEDIVEISCHGNQHIILAVINELLSFGANLADPGEYTRRAFLNGKLDLFQAESVGLLIQAKSLDAAEQQEKNISGKASKQVLSLKKKTISILALIEYELDISEETYFSSSKIADSIKKLTIIKKGINELIKSFELGKAYTQGSKVVFTGMPNVGKSTLINMILKNNKIITSPKPGTTRDVITTEISLGGLPVSLVDTAGIHETKDEIEIAGIEKTRQESKTADVIISVFSPHSQPVDFIEDAHTILVHNKTDLQNYKGSKKNVCCVSALSGDGIDNLKTKIKNTIVSTKADGTLPLITTLRQKESLTKAHTSTSKAINLLRETNAQLELVAHELTSTISYFDITTGKTTTNDVLDSVFSSFCIGK